MQAILRAQEASRVCELAGARGVDTLADINANLEVFAAVRVPLVLLRQFISIRMTSVGWVGSAEGGRSGGTRENVPQAGAKRQKAQGAPCIARFG